MTAQIRDVLYYNGEKCFLSTEPLKQLLDIIGNEKPAPKVMSTACWRGYVGTWEITDDKLYLIGLKGFPEGNEEFNMDFLFPGHSKVYAEWFTDEIKIPKGKMLHYEHMGYMSIFEKDLFLNIEKGNVISIREVDNTKTFDPDDPMGWKKLAIALHEDRIKKAKDKEKPTQ
jgi:hypothetical protein